jgi:adenylate cyclase
MFGRRDSIRTEQYALRGLAAERRAAAIASGAVDWEAEGLLEDLPDDRARAARRKLLDELREEGVELDELKQAVKEERLALLPLERLLGGDQEYTLREVAEQSGLELPALEATRRALGLAVAGADDAVYNDDDIEAAKLGRSAREAGFGEDHILETNRVLGRGMARFAEALRTLSADVVMQPDSDEYELAHRFASVAEEQLPLAREWVQHVFTMHFRQMLRNEAVTLQERTTGRGDQRMQAIAFADIVGFTELGETVDSEELGGVAAQLSRLAGNVVQPPVRLVKMIGDAVMLVAPEPKDLLVVSLDLIERADASERIPALRAGIAYGPAVNQWGDWFGSTVNLASRLTARARPSSVLTTEEVREAVGEEGYKWSSAGPKKLKGFSSPIKTLRVRRPD